MKVNKKLINLLVIAVIMCIVRLSPADQAAPSVPRTDSPAATTSVQVVPGPYEPAIVVRVVDGDTIVVNIAGAKEKVRLIGVDTPESVGRYADDPEPGGVEASDYMKGLLPEGTSVYLEADVQDRDKYDRLLRYVWLDEPDQADVDASMVNALLLEGGYAELMTIPPDVRYVDYFKLLN